MDINPNDKIEDPREGSIIKLKKGMFSCHSRKLVCYIDIQGITNYYEKLSGLDCSSVKDSVNKKLFEGFIRVFSDIDGDIYSLHILSDSAIIVPKSKPRKCKTIPTYHEFMNIVIKYYEILLNYENPSKFIISRDMYFSIYADDIKVNILPGGKVISDCANADKKYLKGKGPGIFSNLPELNVAGSTDWELVDYLRFNCNFKDKNLAIKSLDKISKGHISQSNRNIIESYENIKKWILS